MSDPFVVEFEAMLVLPCVIVHQSAGPPDDMHMPTPVITRTPSKTAVQDLSAEEAAVFEDVGIRAVRLFFLPSVQIDATDRVEEGANVYEIVGPPAMLDDLDTRSEHHIEALAKQVT